MSELFAALSDPTRRAIYESLVREGSGTATALSVQLEISRQAVAKHLAILESSSLATGRRVGRETIYEPLVTDLSEISDWVTQQQSAWSQRLAMLKKAVDG